MQYNILFFYTSAFFYLIGTVLYLLFVSKKQPVFFTYSKQWLIVALTAGFFYLIIRYREQGHLPMVSLFEITYFYAWLLSAVYIIFIKENTGKIIQGLAFLLFDIILIYDLTLDKTIQPLNPLLKSFWLGIHVPAIILSYSAFGISFAISVYSIIAEKRGKDTKGLQPLNSGLIIFGVILLFFGIATGSIWAHTAWGTYWNWDPKETWALITLIIYALAVILEKAFKLKHFWLSVISVVGFLAMLTTFFGVSLFMVSHHAYQQ
ncbi:MAG: cytochrome c biogenesis protein CcsA [Candidatus Omnitrophica bacterium]|nr:cytochrome c biogenesis protein CcsA [Candidatus Omnitrophota bacterium]